MCLYSTKSSITASPRNPMLVLRPYSMAFAGAIGFFGIQHLHRQNRPNPAFRTRGPMGECFPTGQITARLHDSPRQGLS